MTISAIMGIKNYNSRVKYCKNSGHVPQPAPANKSRLFSEIM